MLAAPLKAKVFSTKGAAPELRSQPAHLPRGGGAKRFVLPGGNRPQRPAQPETIRLRPAILLARRDPVHIRGFQKKTIDTVTLALEIGEHAAVEFAGAGKLDPHRINEMAVHQDLVMEVRPRRETRLAEIADNLALPHMGAFGYATGKAGHMIVGGDIAICVLDFDPAAIA